MIERNENDRRKDVARRAHELYVQRGGEPGKDAEDWVRAEKELNDEVLAEPFKVKASHAARN